MIARETFAVSLRKEKRKSIINGRRLKLGILPSKNEASVFKELLDAYEVCELLQDEYQLLYQI